MTYQIMNFSTNKTIISNKKTAIAISLTLQWNDSCTHCWPVAMIIWRLQLCKKAPGKFKSCYYHCIGLHVQYYRLGRLNFLCILFMSHKFTEYKHNTIATTYDSMSKTDEQQTSELSKQYELTAFVTQCKNSNRRASTCQI